MRTKFFFVRSPQAFWQSSAPGVLSTLVTSVVLYSLTQATLMSPGISFIAIKSVGVGKFEAITDLGR